jgi:hypothetical protein
MNKRDELKEMLRKQCLRDGMVVDERELEEAIGHERICPVCEQVVTPEEHLRDTDEYRDEMAETRCIDVLRKHLSNDHGVEWTEEN